MKSSPSTFVYYIQFERRSDANQWHRLERC
jgi:hypothetical protein